MKTLRNILFVLAALALLASCGLLIYGFTVKDKPMDEKNFTLVAAGEGYKEAESEKAAAEDTLTYTAAASCQVSGYSPTFTSDGEIETYWEGVGDYPQYFVMELSEKTAVGRMVLKLNPIEIWGKRTQSFAVEASDDGENFNEILSDTVYTFDWAEGNTVEIAFTDAGLNAKFIRLVFSSNSGAAGGQLAEVELYKA